MSSKTYRVPRRSARLIMILCLTAAWTTANADVTIKQKVSSQGMGGFLNSNMTVETMVSGDKQCENSEVQMNNKMMAMFGGDKMIKTSTITRLDKDVVWDVAHAEKTYTEEKLSAKKARMEQFKELYGDEDMAGEEDDMGMNSDDVEWEKPTFSVENTGKTETIAGYKCAQSIVTMEMKGKHKKTGEPVMMHMTMDLFMAKDVPGLEEINAFSKKEAAALGMDEAEEMSPAFGMIGMLSEFGVESDDILKEAEKIEGYPFRMTMEMRGEGGQFDESPSGMSEEDKAKMDEAMAAMKNLGGLFGGGDAKEDDEAAEDSEATADAADGALFKVTTEITGLSTSAIKPVSFEPPTSYKKISMQDDDSEE